MKKTIAILLLICLMCGLLAGCKQKITPEEAYQIVLEDLEGLAPSAENPHIHNGTYGEEPCFNIFVTVNGLGLQYVVSETGKILHIGQAEHSH